MLAVGEDTESSLDVDAYAISIVLIIHFYRDGVIVKEMISC